MKSVQATFGVATTDINQAKDWLEAATGLEAQLRDSSHWGGDYYLADTPAGSAFRMIINRDVQDDEPILDEAADWEIVIMAWVPEVETKLLGKLLGSKDRFSLLTKSESEFREPVGRI